MFATRTLFLNLISWWYSGTMLSRVVVISVVVAITLLSVVLHTTQPSTIGPLGILIVFILMYVSVLGVLTFLLYFSSRIISRFSASFTVKKPVRPLTLIRSYYFSSVLALAPVMFIGMQSVAEVEVYDLLLIALFVVIACIYISKRTS
jgi:hypothetical protein